MSGYAHQLGSQHTVELTSKGDRACLRVFDAQNRVGLDLEIVITPVGPVVRVRAQGVELEAAGEMVLRCADFHVHARDSIALHAGGKVSLDAHAVRIEARVGTAVVRANDDVQLLGEHVLLNCDREPPLPEWVQPVVPVQHVPLAACNGDEPLLANMKGEFS
jgi:hypothetical protein